MKVMASDESTLTPVLLLSMPQMLDPNFARTVVLLAEYGKHGAFGLVVNRKMAEPAHEVIRPEPPMDIRKDVHLYVGGPVEPNRACASCANACRTTPTPARAWPTGARR